MVGGQPRRELGVCGSDIALTEPFVIQLLSLFCEHLRDMGVHLLRKKLRPGECRDERGFPATSDRAYGETQFCRRRNLERREQKQRYDDAKNRRTASLRQAF